MKVKYKTTAFAVAAFLAAFVFLFSAAEPGARDAAPSKEGTASVPHLYDLVIWGGTVIDPETDTMEKLNVGVMGGTIVALTKDKLDGKRLIDARGRYVVPGFVDIQTYGPYYTMSLYKVADGVTTALILHGGSHDFPVWAEKMGAKGQMLNYGAAFSHQFARHNSGVGSRYKAATEEQLKNMIRLGRRSLAAGALGVTFSPEYTPGATYEEIKALAELAAEYKVPVFMHLRYSDPDPPGTNEEAVDEAIRIARETGAAVHIHHITSTGGTFTMDETVKQIEGARAEGHDITACIYSYNFWGTRLSTARFDRGWKGRFRISYKDLQIAGTDERLTKDTFMKYRLDGKLAVAYAIPEEDVVTALKTPWIMIGSDGDISSTGNSHPRGAGNFSRVIRKYVREEGVIDLMTAVRKMTLDPVRVIEDFAPAMKKKGRIRVGADADLVVFDYKSITDKATVKNPKQYTAGIDYVFIGGVAVREGGSVYYKKTGRLIKAERAAAASP